MLRFPEPERDALALSAALSARIREEIERAGGWLDFSRYMELALYEPGLGYYSAGNRKLGTAGDFVTAPELGSVLAEMLAKQLAGLLTTLAEPEIVEFGAGTGRLARDLLCALERAGLAARYRIVEPSAELAARQRTLLAPFGSRVSWLDRWPSEPREAVVLANEVLDAMPVARFIKRDGETRALGVGVCGEGFAWAESEAEPPLANAVAALEQSLGRVFADGYSSEVSLVLPGWFATLGQAVPRGYLLALDYGLVRREYYHPSRSAGTLICHYRHRGHHDPFLWPGLQDISAWVDFSACAAAGERAGFAVSGFTTQGQFLAASGAAALAGEARGPAELKRVQELATLMLPGEMGERFKVLQLTAGGLDAPILPGRDFRDRL